MPDSREASSKRFGVYRRLSGLRLPRTYVGKFLLVAFMGVHIPLIAIVIYVASRAEWGVVLPILGVALAATLAGTFATLFVQGRLLAPLIEATRALEEYVENRTVPALPTTFDDEVGLLMRHTQECIEHLDEALRLKNDLLAILSHDARSPMTSVRFASQIVRSELDTVPVDRDEIAAMLDVIDAASDRQLSLMNDMLALARTESGYMEVERESIDPEALVRRVGDLFRIQAEKKGVSILVDSVDMPRSGLLADPAKTEQILDNLVSNAIKFTPAGGTVYIGVHREGEEIGFVVRDTGMGIPPDLQSQLFAPFSPAQRVGTAREKGTGFGLWICRTFTEVQGGRLELTSREGEGTEFRVLLPVRRGAEA